MKSWKRNWKTERIEKNNPLLADKYTKISESLIYL